MTDPKNHAYGAVDGEYVDIPPPPPNRNPQGRATHFGGAPLWQKGSPFGYNDSEPARPQHKAAAAAYWTAAKMPERADQSLSGLTDGQREAALGISDQRGVAAAAGLRSADRPAPATALHVNAASPTGASPDLFAVQGSRGAAPRRLQTGASKPPGGQVRR